MAAIKTLGILTGGGDVPGLNPCIKAVVDRAVDEGYEVLGFRRGWAGPININPDDPAEDWRWVMRLNKAVVRKIDRSGGTFLHTSRTRPSTVKAKEMPAFLKDAFPLMQSDGLNRPAEEPPAADLTPHVLRVLAHLKMDGLVAIGGDDTLSYAARLHQEGFPVVAIPKTMDNDVYGTDYCIGFSTAVTRSVDFITALRTPTGSHERIAVIELFGRNSGETALFAAYLANVDRTVIPEVPYDIARLSALLLEDKRANPSNYAILAVSEGAAPIGGKVVESGEADAYGHKKLGGVGASISEQIKDATGENYIYQQLGYLMRSGAPDSLDRMVALSYANLATDLISEGRSGRMVALRDGKYTHIPLSTVISGIKRVDVDEMYDREHYRPRVADMLGKPMFLY
ncbi:MAG: ATP-dependent phosphofructokinase / diphosphate-dependent phosphofructokinase [Chloroflexota bacterium]|nr:ATP-dependent phosphofructokinase / diphosphate-dependent phosphofructokinase [Chloroflexota bacterium]